jgi:hypothetical protein
MISTMFQAVLFGVMFAVLVILLGGFVMATIWLSLDLLFGDYRNWKAIGRFFVKIGHGFKIAAIWIFENVAYLLETKQRNKKERQYRINTLSNRFMNFNKL